MVIVPDLEIEMALQAQGIRLIMGVDEAGRGAWAGPVAAGAVILPLDMTDLREALDGVRDSKQLSPLQRDRLLPIIKELALGIGAGFVSAAEIDQVGIMAATRKAMRLAIVAAGMEPEYVLIDALHLPRLRVPQQAVIKGDSKSLTIAAASVVAKVGRDQWMIQQDQKYPGYGFAEHKGYGTPQHQQALQQLGPSPIHRMSFSPLHPLIDLL